MKLITILVSVTLGALVFIWFVAFHFYDKRRKEEDEEWRWGVPTHYEHKEKEDDFWKSDDFKG